MMKQEIWLGKSPHAQIFFESLAAFSLIDFAKEKKKTWSFGDKNYALRPEMFEISVRRYKFKK